MSGIFGIFNRNGSPVGRETLETMRRAMHYWGPDGSGLWNGGCAGLGQSRFFSFPEARLEKLPAAFDDSGLVFTAEGRVDNREDLGRTLDIMPSRFHELPDSEFMLRAYLRWGEECAGRIYGDWSFAAWHSKERRLFLARDHFGNTSLYYYSDPKVFAFATSRKALLALDLAPIEMDELYLAQILTSWPANHGERTIHKPILRLPPAHTLTVTPGTLKTRLYWRLEDTPMLRLRDRNEYVEAFREVWDGAVKARMRAVGPLASTLSSGLDSGSVTATAAYLSRGESGKIHAYTSVPIYDTKGFLGNRYGDEFPGAASVAGFIGVEHYPVQAADYSPIEAIRDTLSSTDEPGHAAANAYWLIELKRMAHQRGSRVLLTGQMGNMGISWFGSPLSQSVRYQLMKLGFAGLLNERFNLLKDSLRRSIPGPLSFAWMRLKKPEAIAYLGSAIKPDFASRLRLRELRGTEPQYSMTRDPASFRLSVIKPGRNFVGALHNEGGMACGMEVRDPTGDARVLAFTYSVPDEIFIDPASGWDRWLVRSAMQGRIPEEALWNRERAYQAGDLVHRLRAAADEVEAVLNELEKGPAADYLDVGNMRRVWKIARTEVSKEAWGSCGTTLTRGIMAGLFVNEFYSGRKS